MRASGVLPCPRIVSDSVLDLFWAQKCDPQCDQNGPRQNLKCVPGSHHENVHLPDLKHYVFGIPRTRIFFKIICVLPVELAFAFFHTEIRPELCRAHFSQPKICHFGYFWWTKIDANTFPKTASLFASFLVDVRPHFGFLWGSNMSSLMPVWAPWGPLWAPWGPLWAPWGGPKGSKRAPGLDFGRFGVIFAHVGPMLAHSGCVCLGTC